MRSTDILIVDDEVGIRDLLSEILQDEGYTVTEAEDAESARQLRNQTRPAMVLLDIWMPDCDGITLLKEWAQSGQLNMPVVMMSGHASIDTAVEATKIGALDFLEKPIALQKLLTTVQRALKYGQMQQASTLTLEKLGNSAAMSGLNAQLVKIQKHKYPVLLTGEKGSPFELVARTLAGQGAAWVTPAKPEQLLDAGVELLQKAQQGVLYLGDVSQLSIAAQRAVVDLIQKADQYPARIVAYCSRPLEEMLTQSEFESTLINAFANSMVAVPPLREQADDLVSVITYLLAELIENRQIPVVKLTVQAQNALRQYDWPGNLEQLKSVLKSLALNADHGTVDAPQVVALLSQFKQPQSNHVSGGFNFDLPLRELREELEKRYFEYHITQENGNMSRVAQRVGLERTHLYRKLKQLGVQFSKRQAEKAD